VLRSRRDQGGGRHRERRPRFASSSGPCAARPWSSRSSARARSRLTARPEYVMPPFSSGHLRLAASRFEIHAVRDPVRAAFLFVGSSLFVRQCRRMTQGSGGVPCPVCDGFDRREARDRSRDLQPFIRAADAWSWSLMTPQLLRRLEGSLATLTAFSLGSERVQREPAPSLRTITGLCPNCAY